jgi:hypothetical protein
MLARAALRPRLSLAVLVLRTGHAVCFASTRARTML